MQVVWRHGRSWQRWNRSTSRLWRGSVTPAGDSSLYTEHTHTDSPPRTHMRVQPTRKRQQDRCLIPTAVSRCGFVGCTDTRLHWATRGRRCLESLLFLTMARESTSMSA